MLYEVEAVDGEEPGWEGEENAEKEVNSDVEIIFSLEYSVFVLKSFFLTVGLPSFLEIELRLIVDGVMPAV